MVMFVDLLMNALGIVTALLAIGLAYYKWSFQYWKRRNVPYLEPSIPFGNVVNQFKRTMCLGEEFQQLYKEAKAKGMRHCGIYNTVVPTYLVIDLDIAKLILTKDFSIFANRGLYSNEKSDPISVHLFTVNNPRWRILRTKVSPSFTSGKLKAMFQILTGSGEHLQNFLEKQVEISTESIDIKDALARYTIDNIGSCALGMECNSFEVPHDIRKYGDNFFIQENLEGLKTAFSINFPKAARALGIRGVPRDVGDFFMNIVKDVVSYREKNNYTRNDFLQTLIEMKTNQEVPQNGKTGDGKTLTMDEIAAQCFAIVLAGYETSATTLTFAAYELALHQEVQDKVREEVRTVMAKHDNQITYDSVMEMKYMLQVIEETLRKYPGAPFLNRESTAGYKIPGADITLEAGTRIIVPVYGYHHDEEYYPNPEKFDPERFNDENKKKRHPYSYMPFGAGPRQCLGERFGILQVQVGLASLLKSFKLTLHPKTVVPLKFHPYSFLLGIQDTIWMNIEKV